MSQPVKRAARARSDVDLAPVPTLLHGYLHGSIDNRLTMSLEG